MSVSRLPFRAATIIVLFGLGCGSAGDTGWSGTERDSAGVTIVENAESGVWSPDDAWGVEETLRIGVASGDPAYQFGQVSDLAVDDAGRIYVLDAQAQQVRLYDADGEHVANIGDPGSGPGELGMGPSNVFLGPGDTLIVADMANQRVQRFLRDGTEAGSFPIELDDGVPMRFAVTPDARIAYQVRRFQIPGMAESNAGEGAGDPLLLRAADGTLLDTLLTLPAGESMRMSGDRMTMRMFGTEPVWAVLPDDRIVTAMTDEYRLEVRSADGAVERIITRPFEPRPVTESDREQVLDILRSMMEDQGVPPQGIEMLMQNVEFASSHPAFASLLGGPDGTIWVQRAPSVDELAELGLSATEMQNAGSPEWDVFHRDGRYGGAVTLPERFRPLDLQGEDLYGVWRDDLDVSYVVRLRLLRPGAESGDTDAAAT